MMLFIATVAAGLVFTILLIYLLAILNIFFTICPQGCIKTIIKSGKYAGFIHSVPGHMIVRDEDGSEILVSETMSDIEREDYFANEGKFGGARSFPNLWGIYFIGPWPLYKVYKYNFQWWEWGHDGKTITEKPRNEPTDFLFWRFEYPFKIEGLECKDNFKIEAVVQIVTQIICPEKTLFRAKNWLLVIRNGVVAVLRDFVGQHSFEELVTRSTESSKTEDHKNVVKSIMSLNDKDEGETNSDIVRSRGVRIDEARITDYIPEEKTRKFLEGRAEAQRMGEAKIATAQLLVTEKVELAKAAIKEAEGKAATVLIEANAEEERIRRTDLLIASNPIAAEIAKVKALPEHLTTLVQSGAVQVGNVPKEGPRIVQK